MVFAAGTPPGLMMRYAVLGGCHTARCIPAGALSGKLKKRIPKGICRPKMPELSGRSEKLQRTQ